MRTLTPGNGELCTLFRRSGGQRAANVMALPKKSFLT
jgi:hypothetical protein